MRAPKKTEPSVYIKRTLDTFVRGAAQAFREKSAAPADEVQVVFYYDAIALNIDCPGGFYKRLPLRVLSGADVQFVKVMLPRYAEKYFSTRRIVAKREKKKTGASWKGARAMGLPFKDALELFLEQNYRDALEAGSLTKRDILHADKALYQAIGDYEKSWTLPYKIPSVREAAMERFARVVEQGIENAPRRDRDAAHRIARRLSARKSKPTP